MTGAVQKLVIAGASLVATISVAHAAGTRFYLGTDILRFTTKIEDQTGGPSDFSGSADTPTLRLRAGARFAQGLDAELHAVLPQSETYSNTGRANSVKTTVLGLFIKPNFDAGPLNVYALLGYSYADVDLAGTVSGARSISGVAYGAGIRHAFTPNVFVSIDYTQYAREKNVSVPPLGGGINIDTKAIGVGFTYTFGRP